MIRHDIICNNCKKILKDVYFESSAIFDGTVHGLPKCKKCRKDSHFMIYWGGGHAPHVKTVTFVGDLWDKRGILHPGDDGYTDAVIQDSKNKKKNQSKLKKGIND